jgi:hypothetical protein
MNNIIAESFTEQGKKYAIVVAMPMYLNGFPDALVYPFLAITSSMCLGTDGRDEEWLTYSPGLALYHGPLSGQNVYCHADSRGVSSWADESSDYYTASTFSRLGHWFVNPFRHLNDQRIYRQKTTMFAGQMLRSILNDMQLATNPGDIVDKFYISGTMYSFDWANDAAAGLRITLQEQLEFLDWHYRLDKFERNESEDSSFIGEPKAKAKRKVSAKLRRQILERDNYQCLDCGRSPRNDSTCVLHVDHRIPLAKGGTNNPENLQTLCDDCNIGKGVDIDWKLQPPVTVGLIAA